MKINKILKICSIVFLIIFLILTGIDLYHYLFTIKEGSFFPYLFERMITLLLPTIILYMLSHYYGKSKKILFVFLTIIFTLNISYVLLTYLPLGLTEYKTTTNVSLQIPKLSIYEKECCMFNITFKNIRNHKILEKELKNYINKLEKKNCLNKEYYYDKTSNITISEYGVLKDFIFNKIYITYDKGNTCQ